MIVEVCYAVTDRATRIEVTLKAGATVADALATSDILIALSLDRQPLSYAIFGRRATMDTVLGDGDRVEILRPLVVDPMEARRRRALKKQATSR